MGDETRRKFPEEWFQEMRIAADGSVEMVAREPYKWIVAAALTNGVRHGRADGIRTRDLQLERLAP